MARPPGLEPGTAGLEMQWRVWLTCAWRPIEPPNANELRQCCVAPPRSGEFLNPHRRRGQVTRMELMASAGSLEAARTMRINGELSPRAAHTQTRVAVEKGRTALQGS